MSILEANKGEGANYQTPPNCDDRLSFLLVDTINHQAITTILPESDKSPRNKTKEDLVKENALLRHQLSQVQLSTYKESMSIIQRLTEQNLQLTKEKESITQALIAEQDKFTQLKTLVEPTLQQIMEDVTQKLVKKLMKRVPDLNKILLNSTKENGTIDFQQLTESLESHKEELEPEFEPDDDLCEWYEIVEYDLDDAFSEVSNFENKHPAFRYNGPDVDDKQLTSLSEKVTELKTVIISDFENSEFDQLIDQLKLLQATFGKNPSFHSIKSEDFIIIDGEKLDKEGALSLLLKYMGMAGQGVCVAGKSTYWMVGTIFQLASFVGLGVSIFSSPWTAAFLLLGRFTYPILRVAAGI